MNNLINIFFYELNETVQVILDNSKSPQTVAAIPIEVNFNKWGKELFTDRTSITAEQENAQLEVSLLDVAYWPEGKALCLFYGSTPISKAGKIVPASPVDVVGHVISDQTNVIDKVMDTTKALVEKAQ
jgi:uncharacterized protein